MFRMARLRMNKREKERREVQTETERTQEREREREMQIFFNAWGFLSHFSDTIECFFLHLSIQWKYFLICRYNESVFFHISGMNGRLFLSPGFAPSPIDFKKSIFKIRQSARGRLSINKAIEKRRQKGQQPTTKSHPKSEKIIRESTMYGSLQ